MPCRIHNFRSICDFVLLLFMYFFYILYSDSTKCFYVGYTAALEARLIKHNSKHKGFTNRTRDWRIVYSEQFETKKEAMTREKQIKLWKSRKRLEALVQEGSTG